MTRARELSALLDDHYLLATHLLEKTVAEEGRKPMENQAIIRRED